MNPIEQEIALLEIVQGSIMLEGMQEIAYELEKRVVELKSGRYDTSTKTYATSGIHSHRVKPWRQSRKLQKRHT